MRTAISTGSFPAAAPLKLSGLRRDQNPSLSPSCRAPGTCRALSPCSPVPARPGAALRASASPAQGRKGPRTLPGAAPAPHRRPRTHQGRPQLHRLPMSFPHGAPARSARPQLPFPGSCWPLPAQGVSGSVGFLSAGSVCHLPELSPAPCRQGQGEVSPRPRVSPLRLKLGFVTRCPPVPPAVMQKGQRRDLRQKEKPQGGSPVLFLLLSPSSPLEENVWHVWHHLGMRTLGVLLAQLCCCCCPTASGRMEIRFFFFKAARIKVFSSVPLRVAGSQQSPDSLRELQCSSGSAPAGQAGTGMGISPLCPC